MRIRILRDISLSGTPGIKWITGSIADVPRELADKWIKQGSAIQDKSMEPSEVKSRESNKERQKRFRNKNKAKIVT